VLHPELGMPGKQGVTGFNTAAQNPIMVVGVDAIEQAADNTVGIQSLADNRKWHRVVESNRETM
jgi:hypothetical protein|tara:strand:- start:6301 stop:6492 length:192 start_codon:yes stop_codon:yes gene_type:complete